jgi:2-keto-3-deoxy-L-rhamnonate aldolase RhmA
LLQSAGNTPCLVRVPVGEEIWIKKALDAGAAGIVVPQVRNAVQVEQIVSWSKYPPVGERGLGLARAQAYGFNFDHYLETANEKLSVVVQIEHFEAVENIDAICAVEGLDAILIGPNDLAASYNKIGLFTDPEVLAAIKRVTTACTQADKCMGIFGLSADAIKANIAQGYSLLLTSTDSILLGQAGKQLLDSVRSL